MPIVLVCTGTLTDDGYGNTSCDQTAWQEIPTESPLLQMTPEQGSEVAGAMLLVLAAAYAIRLCVWALKSIDENSPSID